MPLNKVKAVTFDFVGTLAQVYPSVGGVYSKVLRQYDIDIDPVMADAQFVQIYGDLKKRSEKIVSEASANDFWKELVTVFLEPYDVDTNTIFSELWKAFANSENWRPLPWAGDVLRCLYEQSYLLGICSNWDSRLKNVIEGFGWNRYVSRIYLSTDLGVEKPSAQFFKEVEKRIKLKNHEILHVGNDFSCDYLAAKRVGWEAVAFQPERELSVGSVSVQKLPELVMLLLKARTPHVQNIKNKANSLISNLRELPEQTGFRPYLGRTKSVEAAIDIFFEKHNIGKVTVEQTIMQNWKEVIGPQFAHRCRPQRIIDNKKLVMVASNAVVRQEVQFLRIGIINRIRKLPGCQNIEDLILRAG